MTGGAARQGGPGAVLPDTCRYALFGSVLVLARDRVVGAVRKLRELDSLPAGGAGNEPGALVGIVSRLRLGAG